MNEKNFDYLKDQLKYTGFGDKLNEELKEKMKQPNDFNLLHTEQYGKDIVSAALHFKKSELSDFFFFNKYLLSLTKEGQKDSQQQTFYTDKGITLKEGYNLLDGRAVYKTLTAKDDHKYNAWVQLDFKNINKSGNYEMKQYHQNYGFDLEKTLAKYPIQELNNEQFKESLIRSLQRGNLQAATFMLHGEEKKLFITPNLSFKTITAYDGNMQRVPLQSLTQKQEQKETGEHQQTTGKDPKTEQSVKREERQNLNGEQIATASQPTVGKEHKVEQSAKKEEKENLGGKKKEQKQRNRHKIAD